MPLTNVTIVEESLDVMEPRLKAQQCSRLLVLTIFVLLYIQCIVPYASSMTDVFNQDMQTCEEVFGAAFYKRKLRHCPFKLAYTTCLQLGLRLPFIDFVMRLDKVLVRREEVLGVVLLPNLQELSQCRV
jgi:hypothetical protein